MNGFELQRLDHVSLNVGDRQRSIAWYRDVLGLEQRGEAGRDDRSSASSVHALPLPGAVAVGRAQAESTGLRHIAFMLGRDDPAGRRHPEQDVEFRSEDHGNALSVYLADSTAT
jgi:catechol-2,3-dioxygenase